jgi:hypothetical protein
MLVGWSLAVIDAFVIVHLGHSIPAFARFIIASLLVSAIVSPLSCLTLRFIELPGQFIGGAICDSPRNIRGCTRQANPRSASTS